MERLTHDELNVIIAGSGFSVNGPMREPFQAGGVLFVPAGLDHRFENFSHDFSTWLFSHSPEGG